MRPIFDSHLDLAWNAVSFNRDLTVSVEEIRKREEGMNDEPGRGRNTLTLVELRKAMVPVCVATLIARSGPQQKRKDVSRRSDLDFSAQSIAYAAHYGLGQYAHGTTTDGPLSDAGIELLKEMKRVGMICDVTHLSDKSMAMAFDVFEGRMLASHHNCRALVPGDRQLTDEQIKKLIAREAVIGVALDAWMLYPNWIRGQTKSEVVGLEAVADHIDHAW